MTWISPPTRREITLVVLCLTAYLFGYNLDSSFQLLGVDPGATQGAVLSRLGFAKTKYISGDGRKPAGWRDSLEDKIFGKWAWDEGHVAGDGQERSQSRGTSRHGASWIKIDQLDEAAGHMYGDSTVNKSLTWWQDDIPQTKVIQHVPGLLHRDFFLRLFMTSCELKVILFSIIFSFTMELYLSSPTTATHFRTFLPSSPLQDPAFAIG